MKKSSTKIVIGMDMSDKKSEICEMNYIDEDVVRRAEVKNDAESLSSFFSEYKEPSNVLIAMEAGTHSPWISELLREMGFDVVVGNPRQLPFIWKSSKKSDRRDAEKLARVARFDKKLLHPITHRSRECQIDLAVIKARDALVQSRTALINSVRGILKSLGYRSPSCSADAYAKKLKSVIPQEYSSVLNETIDIIAQLTQSIKDYDKKIKSLCKEKYPETAILQQVNGVGSITSLAFVLIIDDPGRFQKSRHIGCFLGLVPRRDQSGETDKQLGITKSGNTLLRKLLVQCSQYILGPNAEDCELRRFGKKLEDRGGKAAKKKATVAVARKLSILLHRLWKENAEYDPFYLKNNKTHKKSA